MDILIHINYLCEKYIGKNLLEIGVILLILITTWYLVFKNRKTNNKTK